MLNISNITDEQLKALLEHYKQYEKEFGFTYEQCLYSIGDLLFDWEATHITLDETYRKLGDMVGHELSFKKCCDLQRQIKATA